MDDIAAALTTLFPDGTAFRVAGARGEALLDSALAQPRWPHYRTAQAKAAALHFSLNKNHAYLDGNKRIAVTGSTGFLGTALVERLLRSVPDCELVLLIRAGRMRGVRVLCV